MQPALIPVTCEQCGATKEYLPWKAKGRRFCNRSCALRYQLPTIQEKLPDRVPFVCKGCGVTIMLAPSVAPKRSYCSNPCRYAFKRGANGANAGGGDWMRGEANPNYLHGESAIRHVRPIAECATWRREVFARDWYTCQRCGLYPNKGNQLCAHHIAPWAKHPERRFDVDNGITLCRPCHKWVHSPENTEREHLSL